MNWPPTPNISKYSIKEVAVLWFLKAVAVIIMNFKDKGFTAFGTVKTVPVYRCSNYF